MGNGETTKISPASSKSKSLRTTIPIGIARQFNLQVGDELNWEIEPRNGKLIIVVTPKRRNE